MEIISYQNYTTVARLNSILKEVGINDRFLLEPIETLNELGVKITIPSLITNKAPYSIEIKLDYKQNSLTVSQIIGSINKDLSDLLRSIKPSLTSLLTLQKAINGIVTITDINITNENFNAN
jgi:hypothetical protein